MTGNDLFTLPLWYVAFLFSTVCHEAAHALTAKLGGDYTAYHEGQVSLDPLPHIRREPFGLVLVPLLTLFTSGLMFGWGSAPFNPMWQIRYPKRAAIMALAGPMANLSLALITGIAIRVGLALDFFDFNAAISFTSLVTSSGNFGAAVATFLSIMFTLNIVLFAFNLIPLPPLDGYTIVGLVLSEDANLKLIELSRTPGFAILGILLAWQLAPMVIWPIFRIALRLLFS